MLLVACSVLSFKSRRVAKADHADGVGGAHAHATDYHRHGRSFRLVVSRSLLADSGLLLHCVVMHERDELVSTRGDRESAIIVQKVVGKVHSSDGNGTNVDC